MRSKDGPAPPLGGHWGALLANLDVLLDAAGLAALAALAPVARFSEPDEDGLGLVHPRDPRVTYEKTPAADL